MKVSNIFLMPKETKLCSLCEKEINKKWKGELCESCRTALVNTLFRPITKFKN